MIRAIVAILYGTLILDGAIETVNDWHKWSSFFSQARHDVDGVMYNIGC